MCGWVCVQDFLELLSWLVRNRLSECGHYLVLVVFSAKSVFEIPIDLEIFEIFQVLKDFISLFCLQRLGRRDSVTIFLDFFKGKTRIFEFGWV